MTVRLRSRAVLVVGVAGSPVGSGDHDAEHENQVQPERPEQKHFRLRQLAAGAVMLFFGGDKLIGLERSDNGKIRAGGFGTGFGFAFRFHLCFLTCGGLSGWIAKYCRVCGIAEPVP